MQTNYTSLERVHFLENSQIETTIIYFKLQVEHVESESNDLKYRYTTELAAASFVTQIK
jgi:hypothetical protein